MSATPERLQALSDELDFLDLCDLVLRFAHKTSMAISWKHPRGVTVAIRHVPKAWKGPKPSSKAVP